MAFTHFIVGAAAAGEASHNERLEFLGDAAKPW
jgi:dsRNA-specific ribonuclease